MGEQREHFGELTDRLRTRLGPGWRVASEALPFSLDGDFDGDGRRDTAVLASRTGTQDPLASTVEVVYPTRTEDGGSSAMSLETVQLVILYDRQARQGRSVLLAEVAPAPWWGRIERWHRSRPVPQSVYEERRPPDLGGDAILISHFEKSAVLVYLQDGSYSAYWLAD